MAPEFEQAGAQLIGISIDNFFVQQAFKEKLGVPFPMLSDFNREVTPQYGGFYENNPLGLKQAGKRAVFIIDKEGIVRYKWVAEDAPGTLPPFEEVLEAAKSAGTKD
jgi:glutaredoxin-dependent peroxiredoxin